MPRPCSVCQHPELHEINAALVEGETLRTLAARYGLTRSSLSRHQQAHPLNLGYIPPEALTRKEFIKHLWQFSVIMQRKQHLYCPLCKPERPTATPHVTGLWCDRCGLHKLDDVAERMGFTIIPYHGFLEWREEVLRRYEAHVEEGKPFRLPRRSGTK